MAGGWRLGAFDCVVPAVLCISSCKKNGEERRSASGERPARVTQANATASSSGKETSAEGTEENKKPDDSEGASKPDDGRNRVEEAASLIRSGEWQEARLGFYKEWAKHSPREAIDHAAKNNPGASTACISSILESWAEEDRGAALAWVGEAPPNAERSLWTAGLAKDWPQDQLDALSKPVADLADKPAGRAAVEAYSARLIEEDPVRAFSWMHGSIENPGTASETISAIMGSWATRETEKASGWLAQVPAAEPWRDDAVEGLVRGVTSLDPDTARQWARSITNQGRRDALLGWIDSASSPSSKP